MSPLNVILGRQDVAANMVFHHLGHQSVDGSSHGRNELQYVGAPDFLIERPLYCFHLSTDAANSTQQLRFFANGVRHGGPAQIYDIGGYTIKESPGAQPANFPVQARGPFAVDRWLSARHGTLAIASNSLAGVRLSATIL